MVDFLPKTTFDPNAPNWTGASQKPDASNYKANRTMETLFSGVSDLAQQAITSRRNFDINQIDKALESDVNSARDAQGVGVLTDGATTNMDGKNSRGLNQDGKPTGVIPPGGGLPNVVGETVAQRMGRLYEAYKDGRVGNQYYYSQLVSLTRQTKAAFPGYEKEVDALIQQKTGINPANALRNEALEALKKIEEKNNDVVKKNREWVESSLIYAPPELAKKIMEARARGEDVGQFRTALEPHYYEAERKTLLTKQENAQIVLAQHQQDQQSNLAQSSADRLMGEARSTSIKNGIEALVLSNPRLKAIMDGETENMTPEDLQVLREGINRLKLGAQQAFQTIADMPIQGDPQGRTRGTIMGPEKLKKIMESNLAPILALEQAITDEKVGYAGHFARMISDLTNSTKAQLFKENDTIRNMTAMKDMGIPPEIMKIIIERKSELLTTLSTAVTQAVMPKIVTGNATVQELMNQIRRNGDGKGNPADKAAYREALDKVTGILSTPGNNPAKANVALALFRSKDIVDKFPDAMEVFNHMVKPQMAASIKELGDGAYKQYTAWVLENFQYGFRKKGQDVGASMDNGLVKITFNPEAGQFVYNVTPEGLRLVQSRGYRGNAIEGINELNSGASRAIAAVEELNKSLTVISPFLKENKTDVGRGLQTVFKIWGINEDTPPKQSFFKNLWKAVSESKPMGPEKSELSLGGQMSLGNAPIINFQKASGDNTGTGSQTRTVKVGNQEVPVTGSPDISRLSPDTKKLIEGLAEDGLLDEVPIRSGYRDPARNRRAGGARYSQHMLGGAVDLDVSDLSDEQKAKVLEAAIARGARGIGIYPGGKSLHVDLRQSSPVSWGPSAWGRFKGVDISEQPAWAQPALRKMMQLGPRAEIDKPQDES